MADTIVPAGEGVPSLCVFGRSQDQISETLHHLSIVAWAVSPNKMPTPITPLGPAEPGGAWLVRDHCENFIASDGTLLHDRNAAESWLKNKKKEMSV